MRVENDRMCDGLRCKDAVGRLTTSSPAAKECPKCSSGSNTDNDSERVALCVDAYAKGLRANANSFEYDSCVNKSAFSAVIDERSVEQNNSIGDDDEHFNVIKCDSSASNSFVINGYDNVNALSGTCKYRRENEVKLKHISFDCPIASKKEYAFKSCPSLDSSLTSQSCPSKQNNVCDVDVFSSNSSFLDPCYQSETQSSLPPATPSTPASGVVSQASLDSGVLSAHSFDFSQNFGLEVLDKRRRTASSVSSGIGEMWQSSLDGETCKEIAVEGSHTNRSGSTSATTSLSVDGNNCFNSFVNSVVEDDNKNRRRTQGSVNDVKLINSLTSAHCQGDCSYDFPETLSSSDDVPLSVIFPVASPENSFSMATNVEKVDLISCQSNQSTNIKCEMEVIKKCSNYEEREFRSADLSNSNTLKEIEKFSLNLVMLVLNEAIAQSISLGWSIKCSGQCSQELCREDFKKKCSSRDKKDKDGDKIIFSTLGISSCSSSLCWTPELPFSPSHRTYSRTSKRSSLSFSHDSLVGCPPCQDDSHLIKGAVSHDVLTFCTKKKSDEKKDSCTICLEDDIYSLPIDMVKPYDGTILHPKVINQQPKKRLTTRCAKIRNGEIELGNMSKRIHNNNNIKEQSSKHKQKNKHNGTVSFENPTTKRNGQHASVDSLLLDSVEKTNASKELDQEKTLERSRIRQRKEVKCADQSKLCRIIPFTSGKSRSKNDICDTKLDKKKSRSLSSNIRNTLITFFSFKKAPKEQGNFVNAKNEFIEASSQDLDSSEGIKWGKICPLPSAPPLVTSVKYSAFSERVGSVRTSTTTKPNCAKKCTIAPSESNSSHNIANSNQARQSNSISPASLLSCLGHPRTNSIDEQEHRSKSRKYSDMVRTPSVPTVPKRALPPLPPPLGTVAGGHEHKEGVGSDCKPHTHNKLDEGCDFASIIEKVKNYGWYWGPISGEAAEKVLSNEPDGSFIVRDSSDYHYIFSLTFRLNGVTRHVRIEHDQGNFSFGGFTRFKSQTIVDFIEKAVEHSRSGRYLFFLHRRPVLGPMRVQLLHPVSRFKHVQSLQHLCRFIIVKQVRKDLIHDLPLPQRLKDYLNSPHYYSEQVEQCMSSSVLSLEGATASADSHHSQSPCLQHSSHLRFNSNNNNSTNDDDDTSSVLQSANVRQFPNRISLQEPLDAVHFRTLRCSFNDPGTSYDAALKYSKYKDFRLSSSHSSLENSFLQMYPTSPSPISSGSNSGRPNNHFCSKFSLKKKGAPAIWSSHSSPSSPVPFDYSPDWLSSSDDFPVQANSTKVLSLALNVNSRNTKANEISSKFSRDKKKTSLEGYCGQSASSTSQSVMDAFLIYENRKPNATLKTLSPASTTQSSENYNDDGGQCTMCETVSQPHSSA